MKVIINFILIFCSNCLTAQQFSVLYDHNSFANDGSTIFKTSEGYLSNHLSTDIPNWRLTTLIAHHSHSGELLWDISLSDGDHIFSQTDKNYCIAFDAINNNYFVAGDFAQSDTSVDCPFLIKITSDGQILDTIYYSNLGIEHVFGFRVTIVGDRIYYLCQNHDLSQTYLVQCELNGTYISHTTSTLGFQTYPLFISDNGDGLVVGGTFFIVDHPNAVPWQYVRKFDYDGQLIWTNIIENFTTTTLPSRGAVNALPMDNGNVLFAATATSGVPLTERFRPMIGEIDDATGDTLWTRKYFSTDSIYELYNFKRLSTGEYIGVGEAWYPFEFPGGTYVPMSFIFKLDSEYNLLWKRNYAPEGFAGIVFPHPTCRLNDFVENEDGGITALGRAFTYTGTGPQSGYIQDSWLLRVDREGCLVSGCAVDITEHENDMHLFVYPNPASDVLNIQFPYIDKWQVSIYNMQGALVREESANQLLQYGVNIQELPSGIYTVLCKDTKGKVFMEKVVKQ